jgi:hypothetical protein
MNKKSQWTPFTSSNLFSDLYDWSSLQCLSISLLTHCLFLMMGHMFDGTTWFFLLPFFFIGTFVLVMVIFSIRRMFMQTFGGSRLQQDSFPRMISQMGYAIKKIQIAPRMAPQYLINLPTGKVLVMTIADIKMFQNSMVQTLSQSLTAQEAKEGWIVTSSGQFNESDQNFARFYNVTLLSQEGFMQKLKRKDDNFK